jgi:hypothetical protein
MKSSFICLTALVFLFGCKTNVSAPTPSEIDQTEKKSATFLKTLSAEDRKSYDDLKADWLKQGNSDLSAMTKLYSQAVLQSQTILGEMGYGTLFTGTLDGRTREALLRYQGKNGIFQSGNVDPLTYFKLTEEEKVLDDRLVTPTSYSFNAHRWNDFFSADGAWDYRNDGKALVVSSTIDCFKSERDCTEADATEATLFGTTSVQVSTTYFQITKWNDYEIDAENDQPCEKDQLVAIRDEKTVTMHMISTQPDSISCNKLMGDVPVVDSHLRSGPDIVKTRQQALRDRRALLYQFSENAKRIMQPPH